MNENYFPKHQPLEPSWSVKAPKLDDGGTKEILEQEHKEQVRLINERDAAIKALQGLFDLIDRGELVRDISRDFDREYYHGHATRVALAVFKAKAVLDAHRARAESSPA